MLQDDLTLCVLFTTIIIFLFFFLLVSLCGTDMIGTLCFTVVDDTNSLCGNTSSKILNKEFCDLTCDCLSNHCRLEGYELL